MICSIVGNRITSRVTAQLGIAVDRAELGKIEIPGDIVETKEGFLHKRVVARHFVFSSLEEAEKAKRQATELIREIKFHTKLIKDDITSLRQMYNEKAGDVGSGFGFIGAIFGIKQRVIQDKAKIKREYVSERNARIKDYEDVLSEFEKVLYSCNAVKSDAEDWINQGKI